MTRPAQHANSAQRKSRPQQERLFSFDAEKQDQLTRLIEQPMAFVMAGLTFLPSTILVMAFWR